MPKSIEHSLNWCRLCCTCLTCKRFPRNVFGSGDCKCEERHLTHRAKDVKNNWTTDFRFRHLQKGEVLGLTHLAQEMKGLTRPIEPTLTRANLCGTCQQRLRRAVEAAKEPISNDSSKHINADFRKHRSIRETIRQRKLATTTLSRPETSSLNTLASLCCNSNPACRQIRPENSSTLDASTSTGGNIQRPTSEPSFRNISARSLTEQHKAARLDYINRIREGIANRPRTATNRRRVFRISVYDGDTTLLFNESVIGTMTLSELLYAYYPRAPRRLLYREMRTNMLVSAELPVSSIEATDDEISIKAYVSATEKQARWDLQQNNDTCPYPSPLEKSPHVTRALSNHHRNQVSPYPSLIEPLRGYRDSYERETDTGSSHGHNISGTSGSSIVNTSRSLDSEPRVSYTSSHHSTADQNLPNLSYLQMWNPTTGRPRESNRNSFSVQNLTNSGNSSSSSNNNRSSNDNPERHNTMHTTSYPYSSGNWPRKPTND